MDGEPAAGVQVSLAVAGLAARRPLLLPLGFEDGKILRQLITDAAGRFSTPPLADSTYRLELAPPNSRIELLEPFVVPPPQDLDSEGSPQDPPENSTPPLLDLGDLEMTPGLAVEILMTDESGDPVAGAVASASQGPPTRVMMFQSRSDAEGRAILSGFASTGPVQVTCVKPGFSRLVTKFEDPPTWVECVLRPLAQLTGEVLSDGEGLAGVTVSLPGRDRQATTDSEGRFRMGELDAGSYRLEVAAPGFQVVERSGTVAPGEQRAEVVELEPAPGRWGLVVDAATGEPVAGASLVSIAPPGAVACSSDRDGELFFAAASNRRLILEVTANGYPSRRVELKPEDGTGDEPWLVELETGGRIAAMVWSSAADGPCAGCDLFILKELAAGEPPPPSMSLRTGVDGMATSEDLPAGRYKVYLEEVSSLGSSVHVRSGHNIKPAEVRAGKVTEVVFGEPRETVEIRFRPSPAPGWRLRCAGRESEDVYDPRADGSFEVRRRPGETLALRLASEGVSVSQGHLAADAGDLVHLELPRTSVAGRLTVATEGETLPDLHVRPLVDSGSGAWVRPAPGGQFEVSYLPAGFYRITFGEGQLATFNLAEGAALDLGEVPFGK